MLHSDSYHYILSILVNHDKLDHDVSTFASIQNATVRMLSECTYITRVTKSNRCPKQNLTMGWEDGAGIFVASCLVRQSNPIELNVSDCHRSRYNLCLGVRSQKRFLKLTCVSRQAANEISMHNLEADRLTGKLHTCWFPCFWTISQCKTYGPWLDPPGKHTPAQWPVPLMISADIFCTAIISSLGQAACRSSTKPQNHCTWQNPLIPRKVSGICACRYHGSLPQYRTSDLVSSTLADTITLLGHSNRTWTN